MEVEIKFRLPDAETHQKVATLLASKHVVTHAQENIFFDGKKKELSSKKSVLRFRFYNGDQRCIVTFKGMAVILNGVSTASEVEEKIDVAVARACVIEPGRIAEVDCGLLQNVVKDFNCREFECLGGFRNVRAVYDWESHKIELDETHFEFGINYEIEVETKEPERIRELLGRFLDNHKIPYAYSTVSKFAIFRSGKFPQI